MGFLDNIDLNTLLNSLATTPSASTPTSSTGGTTTPTTTGTSTTPTADPNSPDLSYILNGQVPKYDLTNPVDQASAQQYLKDTLSNWVMSKLGSDEARLLQSGRESLDWMLDSYNISKRMMQPYIDAGQSALYGMNQPVKLSALYKNNVKQGIQNVNQTTSAMGRMDSSFANRAKADVIGSETRQEYARQFEKASAMGNVGIGNIGLMGSLSLNAGETAGNINTATGQGMANLYAANARQTQGQWNAAANTVASLGDLYMAYS